ncbi:MAG: shikimate kinase [Anaerovoracaceae bacterium]
MKKSVILIGMPGCGKSTVGVVLAKTLGYRFIDSDLFIQEKRGKLLCDIIAEVGNEEFNKIEEEDNCEINDNGTVIATGGSVIYGPKAMNHFRELGLVCYIKLGYEEIERRVGDVVKRGISLAPGQSLKDLYDERIPLYEKYAHLTVDTTGLDIVTSMEKIKKLVIERLEEC